MTTLDRDVRLSPDQIMVTTTALRKRKKELGRSIAAAEANHRAGAHIQRGTHERNVEELATVCSVLEALEAARKEIQRHFTDKLGITEPLRFATGPSGPDGSRGPDAVRADLLAPDPDDT